ncbi:DedA family protein [Sinomonas terrae]|uniref:DedA family protein n=1 Tax=Sinomonas terrae TaxID=2908838 RepID=A0ABS9U522_9MICC|nr:DedA family protein [Sinomonas terrae]MCH6471788.1 DedA family protein [Sinomonas terrae]
MGAVVDVILGMPPLLAYVLVFVFVFAEDALFVGFVIPGETAAVLGGVIASQGKASVWLMAPLVVLAAIAGDSVGYEVGKHLGPRLLDSKPLRKHRRKLDNAQDFLRRRGGWAVFLGRFVAFFRAVMPALAGASRMRYLLFLPFNALGGLVWGVGYVLLGFLAGASYEAVAKAAGRDVTAVIVVLAIIAVVVWRVRKARRERREERGEPAAES